MTTEIANETARGQLEETHIKLNLGTCGPTQCAREKTSAR